MAVYSTFAPRLPSVLANTKRRDGNPGENVHEGSSPSPWASPFLPELEERPETVKLGMRVEALSPENPGIWSIARVVELGSFRPDYFNKDEPRRPSDEAVEMICVHYEGHSPLKSSWIPHSWVRFISEEDQMSPKEWWAYKQSWHHGPTGLEDWTDYATFMASGPGPPDRKTGVVWSGEHHACPCYQRLQSRTRRGGKIGSHPENPERLVKIMESWRQRGLLRLVRRFPSREITREELVLAHTERHIRNYYAPPTAEETGFEAAGQLPTPPGSYEATPMPPSPSEPVQTKGPLFLTEGKDSDLTAMDICDASVWPNTLTERMPCGELGMAVDTTFDPHPERSPKDARLAVGGLLNLCDAVIEGKVKNGFALIRPPGHHAEPDDAMGFCIYNNVAVAAKWIKSVPKYRDIKNILIIDWDVHHGNGTERMFDENPDVLYISIHRYDDGNFYPRTGPPEDVGSGSGTGKTINIAWNKRSDKSSDRFGDAEYLAAFHYLIMPIAREFNPDLVFVSAGFDAAAGHATDTFGGCKVTPAGYAMMTHLTSQLAHGRVIMVLEGGYELVPLAQCATASLEALLSAADSEPWDGLAGKLSSIRPCASAQEDLLRTWEVHRAYWSCLTECPASWNWVLPKEWLSKKGVNPPVERKKKQFCRSGY